MKKLLIGLLAGILGSAGMLWSAATYHPVTEIYDFRNGIKIAGVSLSQDGITTFANASSLDDTAGLGTFTFGRTTSGTVTLTAKDDNATAALTILPGGAAAMTLGGASTTSIALTTDGGTTTFDGAAITHAATTTETAATSLTLSGGAKTYVLDAVGGRRNLTTAEAITAAATITADSCGSVKQITSAGAVATNTTDTFTAPAAANTGCMMVVCNTGSNNITLDNNAHFKSIAGADIVLTADDCTGVYSDGTVWRSTGSLVAN